MSKAVFRAEPAKRIAGLLKPTVWHHMTPLAQKHKAVNLGQGFPGFSPAPFVRDALAGVAHEEGGLNYLANQYARAAGNLTLVEALAKKVGANLNRTVDPITEVMVCNGATGVIFNATQALLNPGDEVVTFEPAFDIYSAQAAMAGATVRPVPLNLTADSKAWSFDLDVFRAAFTDKTRMLIFNTPHNPTGKVFTSEEQASIAAVLRDFPDVIVVSDEVYEHLVFDGRRHVSFASIPDMWDRTLTVSSSGKTFSCTGWKIGWAVGPQPLISAMGVVGSWVSFSVNTPSQIAIARCMARASDPYEGSETFYAHVRAEYERKRAKLGAALTAAGLTPIYPEGSFFIMADTSNVEVPQQYRDQYAVEGHDWAFACWLTAELGVACIPPSPFYCDETKHLARNLVRFAFAQEDSVLDDAAQRLLKIRDHLKK